MDVQVEWSDGRTKPVSVSPLEINAYALTLSFDHPILNKVIRYSLFPGRAASRISGPVVDCIFEGIDLITGSEKGTPSCGLIKESFNADTIMQTTDVSGVAAVFAETVTTKRDLIQAASTLLCVFTFLGLFVNFSIAPFVSLGCIVYCTSQAGQTVLFGPVFLYFVLAIAIFIFSPTPPEKKGGKKATKKD